MAHFGTAKYLSKTNSRSNGHVRCRLVQHHRSRVSRKSWLYQNNELSTLWPDHDIVQIARARREREGEAGAPALVAEPDYKQSTESESDLLQ